MTLLHLLHQAFVKWSVKTEHWCCNERPARCNSMAVPAEEPERGPDGDGVMVVTVVKGPRCKSTRRLRKVSGRRMILALFLLIFMDRESRP